MGVASEMIGGAVALAAPGNEGRRLTTAGQTDVFRATCVVVADVREKRKESDVTKSWSFLY